MFHLESFQYAKSISVAEDCYGDALTLVSIPVLVAPLIRVLRPLVFRRTLQRRHVFSESEGTETGLRGPGKGPLCGHTGPLHP